MSLKPAQTQFLSSSQPFRQLHKRESCAHQCRQLRPSEPWSSAADRVARRGLHLQRRSVPPSQQQRLETDTGDDRSQGISFVSLFLERGDGPQAQAEAGRIGDSCRSYARLSNLSCTSNRIVYSPEHACCASSTCFLVIEPRKQSPASHPHLLSSPIVQGRSFNLANPRWLPAPL